MTLAKLQEVIRLKQRPETMLSLETAIQRGEQTVVHYRFTPSIRDYFSEILSLATSDRGQGYWIQAEYGAGKTHFLATLAVLLADRRGTAWAQVKDDHIVEHNEPGARGGGSSRDGHEGGALRRCDVLRVNNGDVRVAYEVCSIEGQEMGDAINPH